MNRLFNSASDLDPVPSYRRQYIFFILTPFLHRTRHLLITERNPLLVSASQVRLDDRSLGIARCWCVMHTRIATEFEDLTEQWTQCSNAADNKTHTVFSVTPEDYVGYTEEVFLCVC
jgi:hypothetical protein